MKWTVDRVMEFQKLEKLLREVRSINSGNCVLERLSTCIALAEELGRGDLSENRKSFRDFLFDLCIEDREAEKQVVEEEEHDPETCCHCQSTGVRCDDPEEEE